MSHTVTGVGLASDGNGSLKAVLNSPSAGPPARLYHGTWGPAGSVTTNSGGVYITSTFRVDSESSHHVPPHLSIAVLHLNPSISIRRSLASYLGFLQASGVWEKYPLYPLLTDLEREVPPLSVEQLCERVTKELCGRTSWLCVEGSPLGYANSSWGYVEGYTPSRGEKPCQITPIREEYMFLCLDGSYVCPHLTSLTAARRLLLKIGDEE